ncbi:serine/threonine-protein kinase [Myxococcus sp. RHSTA-1-4]|uniref:serine/threonine protein kinase n=1 Tax=Myxococcus sp. RHSTA-1-4 TaxID=2874601 RepID=UPI001CBBF670|nr:serine/threonine-protein kinase [Myxococcus sp. RHSTA-1-4]MBZ4416117.1 protein kinase [Myxococcus sp. RHSTA-1-4]
MKGARQGAEARVLSPLALPEGTQVGRWRVENQVGHGGFGTVYAVREVDAPTGPLYALKLARTPEDAGFGREAEALRRVRHPGVARLVEAGRWEAEAAGYPYLVLEYVHGEELYRWAQLRNPTARQVSGLLSQVAEALAAAHALGVMHRDFKGGNVMVGPDGRVVVLDWGAGVYPEAAALTCTARMPPGTPLYYSPQVMAWRTRALRGGGGRYPYTVADEAYAVGVTFYRLLADEYPPLQLGWGKSIAEEGLEALALEPLALLNPRVPEPLAALVMRLLAFRPEARPAHLATLAAEVRRALEGAGEAWDAPLFEWYAGPGSHSRTTTTEDGAWGPLAPGHEAALMRDRMQRPDVRANKAAVRWLRRRHPQAMTASAADMVVRPTEARGPIEPREAVPMVDVATRPAKVHDPAEVREAVAAEGVMPPEAPSPEAPRVAQAAVPQPARNARQAPPEEPLLTKQEAPGAAPTVPRHRTTRRRLELVAMLAAAGLAGVLALERIRLQPASGATEAVSPEVAPALGRPHSPDAGAALASPPPQEPPMPTPSAPRPSATGLVSPLKRGIVACGAAAALACSGPQVRPTPDTPCPDGALEAMRELGLQQGSQISIYVRTDKPGGARPLFVHDGDIVSRVFSSSSLPDDTLIMGRLWTKGETVIGRYTALELPNGRRYPVCLVLCDEDGCTRHPESTLEAPAVGHAMFFKVVDVFP